MTGLEIKPFAGAINKKTKWSQKLFKDFAGMPYRNPAEKDLPTNTRYAGDILFSHACSPGSDHYEVTLTPAIDYVEVTVYLLENAPLGLNYDASIATPQEMIGLADHLPNKWLLEETQRAEPYLMTPKQIGLIMEETGFSKQRATRLLKKIYRGSTKIVVMVSADEAEDILDAFEEGKLNNDIINISFLNTEPLTRYTGWFHTKAVQLDPVSQDISPALEKFVRSEIRKQAIWDSLTDLPALLFPHRSFGKEKMMSYSRRMFFLGLRNADDRTWLKFDLFKGVICWNVLALFILTLALPLGSVWDLTGWVMAIFTGLLLSVSGSLVCSSFISFLGCAAGGVLMTLAFGFAHGLLINHFGLAGSQGILHFAQVTDAFTRVVGGLIGTLAAHPRFGEIGYPKILALLFATGCAIALTADLMAAPHRVAKAKVTSLGQPLRGGIYGAIIGGSMIGIIFGLNKLLNLFMPDACAFSFAFLIIGTTVFGFSVWWRTAQDWRKVRRFAGIYAATIGVLLLITFLSDSRLGLVTNAMATGLFHATFYTLSFLIGEYFGGVRAAVWAAVTEGMVGYLAFVCIRAAQSPWWIYPTIPWGAWGLAVLFVMIALLASCAYYVALRDTRDENAKEVDDEGKP